MALTRFIPPPGGEGAPEGWVGGHAQASATASDTSPATASANPPPVPSGHPPHRGEGERAGTLETLAAAARACTLCQDLPLGPRPILRVSTTATILIASQAPGTKVHVSGTPWTDASGHRLRGWLGMTPEQFYDGARIAILPMGLCYPGRLPQGGDEPPRAICAPTWRPRLLAAMPQLRLTLLVGSYAQVGALGPGTMTERVRRFQDYLPCYFPLPHPSWRTGVWETRNPWFQTDVLPALRAEVARVLGATIGP